MCCDPDPVRKRLKINGYRPDDEHLSFFKKQAYIYDLVGFIELNNSGAMIEAEGDAGGVESFIHDLTEFEPISKAMENVAATEIPLYGGGGFEVRLARRGRRG